MLKFNRKNESGRSMVEMLGVLAIIGVLSVMGISGYTTAMRSHKANEIAAATSMAYIMGMSQNEGKGGSPMVYTPKPEGVSSITFTAQNQIEIAGITDAAVCAQVKGRFNGKVTGDCAASGSSTLTVTLGEVREEETPTSYDCTNPNGMNGETKCNPSGNLYVKITCDGTEWMYESVNEALGGEEVYSGTAMYTNSNCTTMYKCTNPGAYVGEEAEINGSYYTCTENGWVENEEYDEE